MESLLGREETNKLTELGIGKIVITCPWCKASVLPEQYDVDKMKN